MCSLTWPLLRMIGSSSFTSCGLITTTMLSFPDPLERIQLTGRIYSVRPMPSELELVVVKSAVASGEGDHSSVKSKASDILTGTKSEDMYIEDTGRFPGPIKARKTPWMICLACR